MKKILLFLISICASLSVMADSGETDDVCKNVPGYRIPCGSYASATRLTQVDITGEGVLGELHYTSKSSTSYNLYVTERATLARGGKLTINATLTGATTSGLSVSVWADFDEDGQFEQSVTPTVQQELIAELTVPADTKGLKGRIRIRVDQDANAGANADFYGAVYDFPVYITEGNTQQRTLTVRPCAEGRGILIIKGQQSLSNGLDKLTSHQLTATYERGAEVKVFAEATPGYTFEGWRQGRTLVSTEAIYTTTMTENKELVALFSKNKSTKVTQERLLLNFSNTHSDSPVVTVRDAYNEVSSSVNASLVSLQPKQKTENTEGNMVLAATDITPDTDQKKIRTATFCVTGIPEDFYLESMKVTTAATTATGDLAAIGQSSVFNFKLLIGSSEDQLTQFAEVLNQDINKKPGQTLSWTMKHAGGSCYPTDPLWLQIQFDPQDDGNLYSTLRSIEILKSKNIPNDIESIGACPSQVEGTNGQFIYDLTGRRTTVLTKGIYITSDGKKILR